uniref:Uncharacterized protein n=1 Tax=Neolamprologus brichardi TaxID=32507 RepID=A0A3Q4HHB9_NEOBR
DLDPLASIHYWRVPLPELDLSLLEDASDHSKTKDKTIWHVALTSRNSSHVDILITRCFLSLSDVFQYAMFAKI